MTAIVLPFRDVETTLRDLATADTGWPEVAARLRALGIQPNPLAWADYTEAVAVVDNDRGDVVYGDVCGSNTEAARRMACDRESDALHSLVFGRP